MPNESIVALNQEDFNEGVNRWLNMSPEERREAFGRSMLNMANCYVELAQQATAMIKAGDDVSAIPPRWLALLLRIGEGSLLPDVLARYRGILREKISSLPVCDQRFLLQGGKIKLVIVADEKTDILTKDPSDLMPMQIRQVFGRDHIRDEGGQRSWIEERRLKNARPSKSEEGPKINPKHATVTFPSGGTYTRKDLLRLIEEMD